MKYFLPIFLLVIANIFMTLAWYSHLKFKELGWFASWGIPAIVLFSWGIALLEYCFQVPANRIGFVGNGGPFNLWQLKVIQEVLSVAVFTVFVLLVFKTETLRWNHFVGFLFLILAVFFIFKK